MSAHEDRTQYKPTGDENVLKGKYINRINELTRTRLLLILLIFIIVGIILTVGPTIAFQNPPLNGKFFLITQIVEKIGLAILGAAFITIVSQIFILRHYKDFESELSLFLKEKVANSLELIQTLLNERVNKVEEEIKKSIKELEFEITERTQRLVSQATALRSLYECDISSVYMNRRDAAYEMKNDFDKDTSTMQIMGISLNDFVRPGPLHDIWENIIDRVTNNDIKVQLLILHPDCIGAELRDIAEHRKGPYLVGRLRTDVKSTANHYMELINKISTVGTFEMKLYTLSPGFFLFRTDSSSFVQQYHSWRSRAKQKEIPIFRFVNNKDNKERSIHDQMGDHFDWIWENASLKIPDYLDGHSTGRDKGLVRANCINVYNSTYSCKKRMLWLIENAEKNIKLIGVSLKSFFNDPFFDLLKLHVDKNKLEKIEILILDPDCTQAKLRSYREYLLCGKYCDTELNYENYIDKNMHYASSLFQDTIASLKKISDQFLGHQNIKIKLYNCAPSCFALIVDGHAMVEQYHYGKSRSGEDERRILGKDMPVYEYLKESPFSISIEDKEVEVFAPEHKEEGRDLQGRKPYELIHNHFNHIWKHYSTSFDAHSEIDSLMFRNQNALNPINHNFKCDTSN